MKNSTHVNICGMNIHNVSTLEALDRVDELVCIKSSSYVVTPNVDHVIKIQNDQEFKKIYEEASLVVADGMPLIWASHFLGHSFKEKISGSDLMPLICQRAAKKGHRLFFMGGRPGAVDKAKEVLERNFPGVQISGTYCPPMGFEKDSTENEKIIQMIQKAQPDILFLGLGTPKQEKWIYQYHRQYQTPVSIGVGATFEFIAGMVKRAPRWMQMMGLEWLWRLMMEPRRLWKRYLLDDPQFFWLILQQKFFKRFF